MKPSANRTPRIYFAPCGIGLGHVGRTIPIAKKLREQNAEILFSTYREGIPYTKQEGFPLKEAPPIGVRVKPDGSIDLRITAANPGPFITSFTVLNQINAELESMEHFGPDVVVSDSRLSSILAARILEIPTVCILNQFQVIVPRRTHHLTLARLMDAGSLAIIGKVWTSGNIVLIPDFPYPYTISAGNLGIPSSFKKKIKLIGPILPTLSKNLPEKDDLRRKLGLSLDKQVVFAAISGPTSEKAFFSEKLTKILQEFPKEYEIIISYGQPGSDDSPTCRDNVTMYKWLPNRFEFLKACDILIARAGHGTITQAMCYGKPMVLVPTPGQTEQISNARQAMNYGVAKVIFQDNLNKQTLQQSVNQLSTQTFKERAVQIQQEVADYDGLTNAVDAILEVTRDS